MKWLEQITIALSSVSQHLNFPIPSHHLFWHSLFWSVSFPLPICLPDGPTTVPISHRNPPSHLKTSDHITMLSSFITACAAKQTGIKAHAWPVGEKHSGCENIVKKAAKKSLVNTFQCQYYYIHPPEDTGHGPPQRVAVSDDIVSCFWPVSWLKISVVFTVDPVKTKEIFTTLFIHIFNCVESTCLLRLNSVPSLQKQVYARLTPRTREKEKSFSIWACKMPKSLAVHQARIQSLCWYFWLVYLLWWLCLCKYSKTAILPTKTLNQTNILDARLAFPSLGCRMTSCLALISVCIANMAMEVVQTAMFRRLCRMRFTRLGCT